MQKRKPLVSIVITTKNEEEVLERLLKSLTAQTYTNIEIILVDNNSSDDTLKIAQKFKKVKIYQYGPERSAQRNFGANKSKGKYLLFLDADMSLSKTVVEECALSFQGGANIGAVVIPEESIANLYWEKVKAFERTFYNEHGDEGIEAARFFSRQAYKRAGGYDENITGPEDWDLPENIKRLGLKVGRVTSKIYHYERIPSLIALVRKKYYYGLKSDIYLKKNNISPFSAKTIYFLRPIFYKNWKKIVSHPILFLSLIVMLTTEQIGGGIGYLVGKYYNADDVAS